MPDSSPSTKRDDRSSGPSLLRTVVLSLVVAAFAAAISGWYLFGYVPSKLQYFLGLRFRTLAVAASQLRSKGESLSQALTTAKEKAADAEAYLKILVPELKTNLQDGLELDGHRIAWSDLVAQAAAATENNFDDLVLTTEDGTVVWQRERTTTPRIGNLTELLERKASSDGGSVFSLQWSIQTTPLSVDKKTRIMPPTATSNIVNLDGRSSVLLTQPVAMFVNGETRRFFLAGLFSRGALQREAMHVPAEWVVAAMLPFALVFLSLPFLKLATVTSKERYSFGDVVFLAVCTILLAAIGGALPFLVDSPTQESDRELADFAKRIDANLHAEAANFLDLTKVVKNARPTLKPCLTYVTDVSGVVCDVWQSLPDTIGTKPRGFAELDVVTWVDSDGMQRKKWTTKTQTTALISQDYEHFRDIMAKRTWTLPERGDTESFTIEPLRSPTTSDLAFVFAVPNDDPALPMLALNVKPQSLVDTLVPPGFAFAILAPDGRVLFHSTQALSLEENFPRELGDTTAIAQAMTAGTEAWWTGDYHGRQHRFYSDRVRSIVGSPWRIVTFRELEPVLAFSSGRQTSAVVLFSVNVFVMLALTGIYLFAQRRRGRSPRDVLIAAVMRSRSLRVTSAAIKCLCAVGVLMIAGIVATYFVAPGWLDVLFFLFVDAPVAAVILVGLTRRRPEAPSAIAYDERGYLRSAIELFLLALVLGALPAAGMARIAYRVDDIRREAQWLQTSRDQALARERHVRGFVNATKSYSPATKTLLLTTGFAAPPDDATSPYSYQFLLRDIRLERSDPAKEHFTAYSPPWIARRLLWVRGLLSSSQVDQPDVQISDSLARMRLTTADAGERHYTADVSTASVGSVRLGSVLGAALVLGVTFVLVEWARKSLSARSAPKSVSLEDTIQRVVDG
ncbi:MAG TPA: hypothetical protein VFP91_03250, partial [Vicinamibacterales bacterium]|nr:hypothetical protein [Vicinamibacterales bacterium]